MGGMETLSTHKAFGGQQGVFRHESVCTGTEMVFSVYVPDHVRDTHMPVVWYLSGLTCTHANVMEKGEYRRACAELGLIFVAPDTSPRGDGVPDDPEGAYDFGLGAGFYVNATKAPYARHYRMRDYLEEELPALIAREFPADMERQGISGHSMGGHGALTIGLRNPERFRSISAFAPIVAPSLAPWGQKALRGYLGDDEKLWREYDAVSLIQDGARVNHLLIDQGGDDQFLAEQLKPELLEEACRLAAISLDLKVHAGYDHSYYFISTFMEKHLRWHAERLT